MTVSLLLFSSFGCFELTFSHHNPPPENRFTGGKCCVSSSFVLPSLELIILRLFAQISSTTILSACGLGVHQGVH